MGTMRASSASLVVLALLLVICLTDTTEAQNATGIALSNPAGANCPDVRRRKSWDAYSAAEKSLYIAALSDAMKRGYHQKFVELHVEYMSEMEAHKTGVFIYWHRMFLLGYENMLRSLNASYACLTLPVWDHLTNTAKRAASQCSTMQTCSTVLTDLGGSIAKARKSVLVYNVTIPSSTSSVCAAGTPAESFCGNNSICAQCFLRNNPTYLYPAEAYFTSVYKQVFTYSDWKSASSAIEGGVHSKLPHDAINHQQRVSNVLISRHGAQHNWWHHGILPVADRSNFLRPSRAGGRAPSHLSQMSARKCNGNFNCNTEVQRSAILGELSEAKWRYIQVYGPGRHENSRL